MIAFENKGPFFCEDECESMNGNDKTVLHLTNSDFVGFFFFL